MNFRLCVVGILTLAASVPALGQQRLAPVPAGFERQPAYVLRAARLIDGTSESAKSNAAVLVVGNRMAIEKAAFGRGVKRGVNIVYGTGAGERVRFVMKDGVVYRNDTPPQAIH